MTKVFISCAHVYMALLAAAAVQNVILRWDGTIKIHNWQLKMEMPCLCGGQGERSGLMPRY